MDKNVAPYTVIPSGAEGKTRSVLVEESPSAMRPKRADPLSQGGRRPKGRRGVPAPGFLTRRGLIGQHGAGTPCADALSPLEKGDFVLERPSIHRRRQCSQLKQIARRFAGATRASLRLRVTKPFCAKAYDIRKNGNRFFRSKAKKAAAFAAASSKNQKPIWVFSSAR